MTLVASWLLQLQRATPQLLTGWDGPYISQSECLSRCVLGDVTLLWVGPGLLTRWGTSLKKDFEGNDKRQHLRVWA